LEPGGPALPKVIPSQVVALIESVYPAIKAHSNMQVYSGDAAVLAAIINLVDDIPEELLTISGEDYSNFVLALQSMGAAVNRWTQRGGDDPPRTIKSMSPVVIVRETLLKCPDANPSRASSALPFIPDTTLRDSIRLDMSSAADALHRGDFKSATVLAGAAIEALLLWRIVESGITSPPAGVLNRKAGHPDEWTLAEYILVAKHEGFVKQNTVKQVELAQGFRNLIHPGRSRRLNEICDRATALSALAGAEQVIRDFSQR
jgi:hypothetical protein